jgi:hypothetical protein
MTSGEPRVPRSSAQVVQKSLTELRTQRKRSSLLRFVMGVLLLVGLVWGANLMVVGRPVQAALASDPRTASIGMVGHLDKYVILPTLVLDLRTMGAADTNDVLRAVLLVGRDLRSLTIIDRVVLARAGEPVFALSGADFREAGHNFTVNRNPVLVLRSLTEALRLPDGQKPPPLDFGDAARRWANGGR